MKKKHIYTLPEEFLKDDSVPARWKILTLLQGFWFSGLTFYGTNEWLRKELGYSERHIQNALKELEELNLITRNVNGFKRLILPGGCTQTSPQHEAGVRAQHEAGVHHNSDSNSDSKVGELDNSQEIRIVKDDEGKEKKKKKKSPCYEVFSIFKEEIGRYPLNWNTNKTERTCAENLAVERGAEQIRKALQFYRENKDHQFCPVINSPYDLDSKWSKLIEFKNKEYGN